MRWMVGALLVAAAAQAHAKDKPCVVEGKSVSPMVLDVATKGPALKLRVANVAATAHPPEAGWSEDEASFEPARVEVRGALEFTGTAKWDSLPYTTRDFVDASNGMARLAPGVDGLRVRTRGKWAEVGVDLDDVKLRGLFLPCDALTLDPVEKRPSSAPAVEGEAWVPAQPKLTLQLAAGSGPKLVVEPASGEWTLQLHRIERAGAWSRVRARFADGSAITGWVKQAELKKPSDKPAPLSDFIPPAAQPACVEPLVPAGLTVADAKVAADTGVLADRLFEWARVRASTKLRVRYRASDSWAEIVTVPGISTAGACPTVLEEAWIPLKSLELPK